MPISGEFFPQNIRLLAAGGLERRVVDLEAVGSIVEHLIADVHTNDFANNDAVGVGLLTDVYDLHPLYIKDIGL